jgi:hypothetical protein
VQDKRSTPDAGRTPQITDAYHRIAHAGKKNHPGYAKNRSNRLPRNGRQPLRGNCRIREKSAEWITGPLTTEKPTADSAAVFAFSARSTCGARWGKIPVFHVPKNDDVNEDGCSMRYVADINCELSTFLSSPQRLVIPSEGAQQFPCFEKKCST